MVGEYVIAGGMSTFTYGWPPVVLLLTLSSISIHKADINICEQLVYILGFIDGLIAYCGQGNSVEI